MRGHSRLLTVSEVGYSAALSAAIYPIPKLTVQVRLSSLFTGNLAAAGQAAGQDPRRPPGECRLHRLRLYDLRRIRRRSHHPRSIRVGSDQASRQSDPFTWFVNTAVARTNIVTMPGPSLMTATMPDGRASRRLGAKLGATGTNDLVADRTGIDNAQRPLPRSRTDLNGSGRPRWYLRIR